MKWSRRKFLVTGFGGLAALWTGFEWLGKMRPARIPGKIVGANWKVGHLLRGGNLPPPSETRRHDVVIAGGGMAGLSAAWRLNKAGFRDFVLLELENEAGGNARSGQNAVSAYPWGAHYVPLPGPEARITRELFEELGIIQSYDAQGLPFYNEYYLCAEPQERLFIHGQWQDGLIPQAGASAADRRQYREFFSEMERFKTEVGHDGRPAFNIPIDSSSRDPQFLKYDEISMAEYLAAQGWDSEYLRWYINYCCRDDYGATMEDTSAWAGIHYFAARSGKAANPGQNSLVTWPEGNGWLARRLRDKVSDRIQTSALVWNVEQSQGDTFVDYYDVDRERTVRISTRAVIFAAPRFVANHVVKDLRENAATDDFVYSPWMVANITLKSLPGGRGVPLAWDNVLYRSDSLGYVVATHQNLSMYPKQTVITYYLPLSSKEPRAARDEAINRRYEEWVDLILKDLSHAHPGLESQVTNLDVWLWGHGMIRPRPGFIWGKAREAALQPRKNIFFAHSDMSGISIFEEAQYHGVMAANEVLKQLNAHVQSS